MNHRNNPSINIDQAVILCGGLGTRLRPLTESTPKPMVSVNGFPFLFHLMNQISDQGVNKFMLLTGYLGEQINEYFGDGTKWGWNIVYSEGPSGWDTGKRLWEARDKLEENFLLLYSDNFATLNLSKLLNSHESSKNTLTLSISAKESGNIKIGEKGEVVIYDQKRVQSNLSHVEIGYMIANKDSLFSFFEKPEVNLSSVILKMVEAKKVGGYLVKDGYRSISDPKRLKITEKFLKPKRILLIDRDGVINKRALKGEYVSKWNEFEFISKTVDAMKVLSEKDFKFIVISNQAGVARGMIKKNDLDEITRNMIKDLKKDSIKILKTYICTHHWEDGCDCRKPQTGLFNKASEEFNFRLDSVIFIGDDSRDCQAAYNANCASYFVGNKDELLNLQEEELPIGNSNDLLNAVPEIEAYYQKNDNLS